MSNRLLLGGMFLLNILLFFACTPSEEKISTDPSLNLTFSEDTLTFDTLYSEIKSTTKRLKVYNPSENAILINSIRFQEATNDFQISLFGENAQEFNNITLFGKDSLMLLLDATLENSDQNDMIFLENQLQFSFNAKLQELPVQAWKQDVHIIGANETETLLENSTHWTADRPYVLRGNIIGENLLVDAGATILMDNFSSIIINQNIQLLGSLEDTILIQSIRQDEYYANAPNQWNGIFLSENSQNHIIQNTIIKNGRYGIFYIGNGSETANLSIENTLIANMEAMALLGVSCNVKLINSIIYNSQIAMAFGGGGKYELVHNTFANFTPSFFQNEPSFNFSNYVKFEDLEFYGDTEITLTNNILWGDLYDELFINQEEDATFLLSGSNNIIKTTSDEISGLENTSIDNPVFTQDTYLLDFRLDAESPAINNGVQTKYTTDFYGIDRSSEPDIGAIEWVEAEAN